MVDVTKTPCWVIAVLEIQQFNYDLVSSADLSPPLLLQRPLSSLAYVCGLLTHAAYTLITNAVGLCFPVWHIGCVLSVTGFCVSG